MIHLIVLFVRVGKINRLVSDMFFSRMLVVLRLLKSLFFHLP